MRTDAVMKKEYMDDFAFFVCFKRFFVAVVANLWPLSVPKSGRVIKRPFSFWNVAEGYINVALQWDEL